MLLKASRGRGHGAKTSAEKAKSSKSDQLYKQLSDCPRNMHGGALRKKPAFDAGQFKKPGACSPLPVQVDISIDINT